MKAKQLKILFPKNLNTKQLSVVNLDVVSIIKC